MCDVPFEYSVKNAPTFTKFSAEYPIGGQKIQAYLGNDECTPVTFSYHGLDYLRDISTASKTLYWVDDIYGGEIAIQRSARINDQWTGGVELGDITVAFRGERAVDLIKWDNWQGNSLGHLVDPAIRQELLGESQPYAVIRDL